MSVGPAARVGCIVAIIVATGVTTGCTVALANMVGYAVTTGLAVAIPGLYIPLSIPLQQQHPDIASIARSSMIDKRNRLFKVLSPKLDTSGHIM